MRTANLYAGCAAEHLGYAANAESRFPRDGEGSVSRAVP